MNTPQYPKAVSPNLIDGNNYKEWPKEFYWLRRLLKEPKELDI